MWRTLCKHWSRVVIGFLGFIPFDPYFSTLFQEQVGSADSFSGHQKRTTYDMNGFVTTGIRRVLVREGLRIPAKRFLIDGPPTPEEPTNAVQPVQYRSVRSSKFGSNYECFFSAKGSAILSGLDAIRVRFVWLLFVQTCACSSPFYCPSVRGFPCILKRRWLNEKHTCPSSQANSLTMCSQGYLPTGSSMRHPLYSATPWSVGPGI